MIENGKKFMKTIDLEVNEMIKSAEKYMKTIELEINKKKMIIMQ